MKEIVLVGFSVNTEIVLTYKRLTSQEKGTLNSIVPDLCGTSANVARAITSLGQSSKVLALTGVNDDFESHILRFALEKFPVPYTEFRILNHSHISVYPIDEIPKPKVFGKKGSIEAKKLGETIGKISEEDGVWRVATGVRPEEVLLVKELFNKHAGHRSLNPRSELIKDQEKFLTLLQSTDLLIMNHAEFDLCEETSIDLLHKYGPRLVIVTKNSEGGMFSREGNSPEKFKPCKDYAHSSQVYETGAGDWFHAAFIVRCIELGKSIDTLTMEDIRECILFASHVAGKKITMKGAANGPIKADLKFYSTTLN